MAEGPVSLGQVLRRVTSGLGFDSPRDTARIWRGWAQLVGPAIAKHAEPTSLRDRVLRVRTDSPIWATEVAYLAEELRSRVNGMLGREIVAEVRVWTGPGAPSIGGAERPEKLRPDPPRHSAEGDPFEALERARKAWVSTRRGTARQSPQGTRGNG